MDPYHVLLYNTKTTNTSGNHFFQMHIFGIFVFLIWCMYFLFMVSSSKLQVRLLESASAEYGKRRREKASSLQNNLDLAIQSVASYVERSDTLVILAPPTVHEDRIRSDTSRKTYTCYRTWRRRGFCLLELFACFFSRRKLIPFFSFDLVRNTDVDFLA